MMEDDEKRGSVFWAKTGAVACRILESSAANALQRPILYRLLAP
jgi:hypothetical protein